MTVPAERVVWKYHWMCTNDEHRAVAFGCTNRWTFDTDAKRDQHIRHRVHTGVHYGQPSACHIVRFETPADMIILPRKS